MRPPRLATRLLRRALPEDVRDAIDGDMREVYMRRRSGSGAMRAHLWYWRTTLALAARFAPVRLREMVDHVVGRDRVPSALDFKLGARMLRKYPGLTLVGGMGMAVATAIGAGTFAFINTYVYPDLPLHEGERVVSIVNWDTRRGTDDPHILRDFVAWRDEAKSLVEVGAFRTVRRNLIDSTGLSTSVSVGEMSAAGFRVARIPPYRGRVLLDADERQNAPAVMVIGHDVWTERFNGDPDIIGRTVRLGRVAHTIVGVMPKGFAFPINHRYWIPLRADSGANATGDGPALKAFARLAPGVTRKSAQAELTIIGERRAEARRETRGRFVPRVVDYGDIVFETTGNTSIVVLIQTVVPMLLVLVCLNVAMLVYARTVVRTGEIALRTALGASRGRIVMQLFAEALVLSLLAASAGLGLILGGLRFVDGVLDEGGVPFWITSRLSPGTVVYTLALAVLGAIIVGVGPALRATRGQLRTTLSTLTGGSKPQLGRTWTSMIVIQVAVAVVTLPPAMLMARHWVSQALTRPGFPSDEYLSAGLRLEREATGPTDAELTQAAFENALRASQSAVVEGLRRDPAVAGVTFGAGIPGYHSHTIVGFDGSVMRRSARGARIGADYFSVFDVKFVAGRPFVPADVAHPTARPVIVNRTFVAQMPGGGNAVGRRIRFPMEGGIAGPDTGRLAWREIIGVVEDFPAGMIGIEDPGDTRATLYEPIAPGELQSVTVFVRVRGSTAAFAPRFRAIAAAADPTLQLRDVQSVEEAYAFERRWMKMAALAIVLVVGSVLLLSAAGMYALMSFTVSQRRREIGVRSALGGGARHILVGVLGRAALQLGIGVTVGLVLVYAADRMAGGALLGRTGPLALPATALFMVAIGLAAAAAPARYGLRIQPTEALRSE